MKWASRSSTFSRFYSCSGWGCGWRGTQPREDWPLLVCSFLACSSLCSSWISDGRDTTCHGLPALCALALQDCMPPHLPRPFAHPAWRPLALSLLVVCGGLQMNAVVGEALEERESKLGKVAWRWDFIEHYAALEPSIPRRRRGPCRLRHQPWTSVRRSNVQVRTISDDPIHDSIEVVSATHVVTGGMATRFAWEDDAMVLLGAPIVPGDPHHQRKRSPCALGR